MREINVAAVMVDGLRWQHSEACQIRKTGKIRLSVFWKDLERTVREKRATIQLVEGYAVIFLTFVL